MPVRFTPRLDILPPAQRRLWPQLSATPPEFTLYGGTAIALHLGHRSSVDFDFFAATPFAPNGLMRSVNYLANATVRQSAPNTLAVTVNPDAPVQLSFFGGLNLGEVAPPGIATGPDIKIASLLDLAGCKVAVVTQRAELKDYLDIHALLTQANIPLAEMLAAARVIYGDEFSPLLCLKALAYHEDAGLAELSANMRRDLLAAVKATDPQNLPALSPVRQRPGRP
jgi:Nucleotidyl transferase AbiEii toxin, Type IV TA system